MSVIIESVSLPEKGPFTAEIKVNADIQVAADDARRQVGIYVGNHIADLLSGEMPTLVVRDNGAVWRVPVVLSSRSLGRIGVVGTIDVNVESGELIINDTIREEIETNAHRFAAGTAL